MLCLSQVIAFRFPRLRPYDNEFVGINITRDDNFNYYMDQTRMIDKILAEAHMRNEKDDVVLYCTYSTYVPYSLSPYRVLNSDTASALALLSRHIVISPISIASYLLAC